MRTNQGATRDTETRATLCSKSLPDGVEVGQTTSLSIISDNVERTYLINIPESYETQSSSPVILSFHGGTETAWSQLELDNFTSPDFNTLNAIVVYPQGIDVCQFSLERCMKMKKDLTYVEIGFMAGRSWIYSQRYRLCL